MVTDTSNNNKLHNIPIHTRYVDFKSLVVGSIVWSQSTVWLVATTSAISACSQGNITVIPNHARMENEQQTITTNKHTHLMALIQVNLGEWHQKHTICIQLLVSLSLAILLLQLPLFIICHLIHWCGLVAEWLGSRTCNQQVAGSNPSHRTAECNPGQVVYTHVLLSPSSIIWYRPMGGDARWPGPVG